MKENSNCRASPPQKKAEEPKQFGAADYSISCRNLQLVPGESSPTSRMKDPSCSHTPPTFLPAQPPLPLGSVDQTLAEPRRAKHGSRQTTGADSKIISHLRLILLKEIGSHQRCPTPPTHGAQQQAGSRGEGE